MKKLLVTSTLTALCAFAYADDLYLLMPNGTGHTAWNMKNYWYSGNPTYTAYTETEGNTYYEANQTTVNKIPTINDNVYFVDFVNFSRSNLPEGWNDEIGGTFQLLDRRWYNSSRQYWRGNMTYESPFILLRPLNRWLGMIQQERLYGGLLFMPHLNPYIELGYGIGTHVFDVGAFTSFVNGKFDTVGFKFTFELFND